MARVRRDTSPSKSISKTDDARRLETIQETLDAMCDAGGLCTLDAFDDEASLRALAKQLRLPYLQVQLMRVGIGGLTEADVDEYNEWRAVLNRKAGVR